jgi:ATP-dependent exoDNAse (exonuclease V) beta subunit
MPMEQNETACSACGQIAKYAERDESYESSGTDVHNKIISLIGTDIKLIPSTHQYVLASNKTLKFKSVTELIAKHFEPFDSKRIAKKLVTTHPKYARYTVDELIAKWKAKTDRGTFVHNELEKYIEEGKEPRSKISKHGARWFDRNILGSSSTYGSECFCEVLVFDEELGVAGLIDLLVCDKKTGNAYIFDWKTSKKIDRQGYNGKTGTTNATRTLQDCRYSKYALQTTLYRYILEKRFHIPIRASYIIHLTPAQRKLGKDGAQLIETEYLKMNAEKILAMM